jgi:hypothetical protein
LHHLGEPFGSRNAAGGEHRNRDGRADGSKHRRVVKTNTPIGSVDLLEWLLDEGLARQQDGLLVPTDRGRELGAGITHL